MPTRESARYEHAPAKTAATTAFPDFYRVAFRPLTGFLVRAGADSLPEAEDIAQDAMAAAYKRFSTIENPVAYVRRVAIRILIALREKQRNGRALTAKLGVLDEQLTALLPQDSVEALRLLRTLKPEQLLVMALTVGGFTPTEIAEMTDQRASTVRTNLRHARKNLEGKIESIGKATRKETDDGT